MFAQVFTFFILSLISANEADTSSPKTPQTIATRTIRTKYGAFRGKVVRVSAALRPPFPQSPLLPASSDLVEAYLGVPYATPPVGGLRFAPPVTPTRSPPDSIRYVQSLAPVCPQQIPNFELAAIERQKRAKSLRGISAERRRYLRRLIPALLERESEDCLYLNIYLPHRQSSANDKVADKVDDEDINIDLSTTTTTATTTDNNNNDNNNNEKIDSLPVVVLLHSETYEWGSGNVFDGSALAIFAQAIVVTVNFRLGIFGFLPTFAQGVDGATTVRGNYALMDQLAALRWIQENIGEFGGSAKNVTLVGHAYGAACAHLLMLSPLAKGLFTRVVLMSGSAAAPWALVRADAGALALEFGRHLNCTNLITMIDCLRTRNITQLISAQRRLPSAPDHLTTLGPIVDSIVIRFDPFIFSQSTASSLASYDLLLGGIDSDAGISACRTLSSGSISSGDHHRRLRRIIRTLTQNLYDYQQRTIAAAIENEYGRDRNDIESNVRLSSQSWDESILSILVDAITVAPLIRTAALRRFVRQRTYFYMFHVASAISARDDNNTSNDISTTNSTAALPKNNNMFEDEENKRKTISCSNNFDFAALLGGHHLGQHSDAAQTISQMFMQYFCNFIRTGDPNLGTDLIANRNFNLPFWPLHEPYQSYQRFDLRSGAIKVRDYRNVHRFSLWLDLIPRLLAIGKRNNENFYQSNIDNNNSSIISESRLVSLSFASAPISASTTAAIQNLNLINDKISDFETEKRSIIRNVKSKPKLNFVMLTSTFTLYATLTVAAILFLANLVTFRYLTRQTKTTRTHFDFG